MSRKRRRIRANRARRNIDLAEIFQWIEQSNMPKGGWDFADPISVQIAHEKIRIAKKVAERVYNLQHAEANFRTRQDGRISNQEKRRVYKEAYEAANRELEKERQEIEIRKRELEAEARRGPQYIEMATAAQIERARMDGYAQGVVAGRALAAQEAAAPRSPRPEDIASIRDKMQKEMLEQCRVIAESNPSMAPGVNAVRHRIRKL
jgi:hypothetical protein